MKKSRSPTLIKLNPDCFIPCEDGFDQIRGILLGIFLCHNDIVSQIKFSELIEPLRPTDVTLPTRRLGDFGGLTLYLERLHASTLNELLFLIKRNRKVLQSPKWLELEGKLSKDVKINWENLKRISFGEIIKEEVYQPLVKIRNQIGFHYDPQQLLKGYKRHLQRQDINSAFKEPYVKNGTKGSRLRFYFADAAAIGCHILLLGNKKESRKPLTKLIELLPNVTVGLFRAYLKLRPCDVIGVEYVDQV